MLDAGGLGKSVLSIYDLSDTLWPGPASLLPPDKGKQKGDIFKYFIINIHGTLTLKLQNCMRNLEKKSAFLYYIFYDFNSFYI